MYNFVKPLSFVESRFINFPKAANNIKVVDIWGKERIIPTSAIHNTNFDGLAITRLPANSAIFNSYKFICPDVLETVKKWLGDSIVKESSDVKYTVNFPPRFKKAFCTAEAMGYKQVKAKYAHNYFANPKYDVMCFSSNIRTDHIYVRPAESIQKPMFVEDIKKPRKIFHNYITGKDEYREIGIWANMATYLANQPIDAFKDDSKERAQKLIKKYSTYLDLLSTETKHIMAKPYKKED